MISIAIPSKTEKFLYQTTVDILNKAKGDIEIFPILDGYELPENEIVTDPRVKYIKMPATAYTKKRHGVNAMVEQSTGEFVMSVDAHCMFDEGFDLKLVAEHQDKQIQIPRRHRLDADNWCLQIQSDNRPPIDYEYIMYDPIVKRDGIHGFKWDKRTLDRWDIQVDETMEFQGSCWFMSKDWYKTNGFMQIEGYTGWGQEAEELGLTTWMNGGRVVTNKKTWYAHLHKGAKHGRMYWMSRAENRESYAYSYNKWIIENKKFFISLIEKFEPLPKWSTNWKDILWKL
jgi:hypothetical protein